MDAVVCGRRQHEENEQQQTRMLGRTFDEADERFAKHYPITARRLGDIFDRSELSRQPKHHGKEFAVAKPSVSSERGRAQQIDRRINEQHDGE